MSKIITLTTDFGLKDPYIAQMKGVILSISPNVKIIDITHNIEKFNIIEGAFTLAATTKFFPKGTIHVVVIDPGVGTERNAIIIKTERYYYVGPDNGVLTYVIEREEIKKIIKIKRNRYVNREISNTFHGRDVFAPAAAYIAKGVKCIKLGEEKDSYKTLQIQKAYRDNEKIYGKVIYIDSFGNIITNINRKLLKDAYKHNRLTLKIGDKPIREIRLVKAYGELNKGELLAIIDSYDLLEIAVNRGNASDILEVKVGDRITIHL